MVASDTDDPEWAQDILDERARNSANWAAVMTTATVTTMASKAPPDDKVGDSAEPKAASSMTKARRDSRPPPSTRISKSENKMRHTLGRIVRAEDCDDVE